MSIIMKAKMRKHNYHGLQCFWNQLPVVLPLTNKNIASLTFSFEAKNLFYVVHVVYCTHNNTNVALKVFKLLILP